MDHNLLYSIDSFPPLPESITEMNELCRFEEIDLKAFIRVIESDPILYTDILRYSNVPYHGFRNPITSIAQAISLFGIAAIRGMALTAALKAHPFSDVSAYGISVHEWFAVMEKQQRFLDIWLNKKHRDVLQSLGGLTFILEIGRLVASYVLMFTQNGHRFAHSDPDELALEEKNMLGSTSDELAAKLFGYWNFDPLVVDALCYSLSPTEGVEPKICAALRSARLLFTLREIKPFTQVEPLLEEFGFHANDAKIAYETVSGRS